MDTLEQIRECREDLIATVLARDAFVRYAAEQGLSLRKIAEAAGVSYETVRRIVRDGSPDS